MGFHYVLNPPRMSCPGSEDAEGSNLKDNPSDLDDRRRLDSPSDHWEDNVTATGTTDRCAGASSLHVPVMAAPSVLEKSLQEFIKQGTILRTIQRGMTDLCSCVGDLELKRGGYPYVIGIQVRGILVKNGNC